MQNILVVALTANECEGDRNIEEPIRILGAQIPALGTRDADINACKFAGTV